MKIISKYTFLLLAALLILPSQSFAQNFFKNKITTNTDGDVTSIVTFDAKGNIVKVIDIYYVGFESANIKRIEIHAQTFVNGKLTSDVVQIGEMDTKKLIPQYDYNVESSETSDLGNGKELKTFITPSSSAKGIIVTDLLYKPGDEELKTKNVNIQKTTYTYELFREKNEKNEDEIKVNLRVGTDIFDEKGRISKSYTVYNDKLVEPVVVVPSYPVGKEPSIVAAENNGMVHAWQLNYDNKKEDTPEVRSTDAGYYVPAGGPSGSRTTVITKPIPKPLPSLTNPGHNFLNDFNPYENSSLSDMIDYLKNQNWGKDILLGSKGTYGLLEAAIRKASNRYNLANNLQACAYIRDQVYLQISSLKTLSLNDYETNKLADLNAQFKALNSLTEQATAHKNLGKTNTQNPEVKKSNYSYEDILQNTKDIVLATPPISLKQAIADNVELYSPANIEVLLDEGINANTLATATDYVSKVKGIIKEIKELIEEHRYPNSDMSNLIRLEKIAEQGLITRRYKSFLTNAIKTEGIEAKLIGCSIENIGEALITNDPIFVAKVSKHVLYAALNYYFSIDGKISDIQNSKNVFGEAKEEYKNGLLALMEDKTLNWESFGVVALPKYVEALELLFFCNNLTIITEEGIGHSNLYYFSHIYLFGDKSVALLGSLNENSFRPENLDTDIVKKIKPERLENGLKNWKGAIELLKR